MKKKTPVRRTPAPKTLAPKAVTPPATTATAVPTPPATAIATTAPVVAPTVTATVPATAATPAQAAVSVTPTVPAKTPVTAPATPAADPAADALLAARCAALRNPSAEVAVDAAAALAGSGDARAVKALVQTLTNADGFCHTVTRAAAAIALSSFAGPESTAALLAAVRDPMAEVSREAVLALGVLGRTEAAPALIEIAANADGYYLNVVRHAAVRSLGRMKVASAKPVLETLAGSGGEEPALAAAARDALAQL